MKDLLMLRMTIFADNLTTLRHVKEAMRRCAVDYIDDLISGSDSITKVVVNPPPKNRADLEALLKHFHHASIGKGGSRELLNGVEPFCEN